MMQVVSSSPVSETTTVSSSSTNLQQAQIMSHNLQTFLFSDCTIDDNNNDDDDDHNCQPSSPPEIPDPPSARSFQSSRLARCSISRSIFPAPNLLSATTPKPIDTPVAINTSSPVTSALAADMSVNFHIAQTPTIPTPRRALFPIHSTSPLDASMEDSPLPNKQSSSLANIRDRRQRLYCRNNDNNNHRYYYKHNQSSPPTSALSPLIALSHPMQRATHTISMPSVVRRKSLLTTPTMGKENIGVNFNPEATPPDRPDFLRYKTSVSSTLKPYKVTKSTNTANSTATCSVVFRDSFKTPRPGLSARLNKARRTHSMFQSPKEFFCDEMSEKNEVVQTIIETVPSSSPTCVDDDSQSFLSSDSCSISTFLVSHDPFRRIHRDTLCELLDGKHSHAYDRLLLIDCRFEYEYEGGHIDGAININSKMQLEEKLLGHLKDDNETTPTTNETLINVNERLLLVFHCEYSAHRGPRMAMHLRNCDRQVNMKRYPKLYYPDIVILDGGYAQFFEAYYDRCVPQRYIEMNDSSHARTCERELHKFRRNMRITGFKFPLRHQNNNDLDASATPTGVKRNY